MPLLTAIARPHRRVKFVYRPTWYQPLFTSGEVGMVFDFTDITTLFQDTAGTTPCTAVGDTISAVKDELSGALCVLTAGTATLQFDSTLGLYYCAMGTTANYESIGTVPSAMGGNATCTLIGVLTLTAPTNSTYMPCRIGPASPSNGNAIQLSQWLDGSQVVEILQFGTGRGRTGVQQSGTKVLIGRKNLGGGPGALDIWWGGVQVDNLGNPTGTLGNITTMDYRIGAAGGIAMNIYRSACINRPITTTEIATISTTALQ